MSATRDVPRRLGDYVIGDVIGRGGMGTVFRGHVEATGEPVAIKVLLPELASNIEYLKRFRREVVSAAKLTNPHVVRILDSGEEAGWHYLAMELLEGGTDLAHVLRQEGPVKPERAVNLALQLCAALEDVHQTGVVHRDVKPGNVMLLPGDHLKLMDFGLARVMELTALTATGEALGSPRYMAPEILQGKVADYRSDVYQVGLVLYEMLTGVPAYDGESFEHLLHVILETEAPEVTEHQPFVSSGLAMVIRSCMKKRPGDRYGSIAELKLNLQAIQRGEDPLPPAPREPSRGVYAARGRRRATGGGRDFKRPALGRACKKAAWGSAGFFLVILLLFMWRSRGDVSQVDYQVSLQVGFRSIQISWYTAILRPTVVRIRSGDGPIRSFTNRDDGDVQEHRIVVSDLQPGTTYRAQLAGTRDEDGRPIVVEFSLPSADPPSDITVERHHDKVVVTAVFPVAVRGRLEGQLHDRSVESVGDGTVAPDRRLRMVLEDIPAHATVRELTLVVTDSFGDERNVPLGSNPGMAQRLIETTPQTGEADQTLQVFLEHADAFFSDPGEDHTLKSMVYERLLRAGVSPESWSSFVQWRPPVPQDGLEPRDVSISGPSLPSVVEAVPKGRELRGVGVVFLIRIDDEPQVDKKAALQILRTPIPSGASMIVLLNDGFEMRDVDDTDPEPDRAVIFPAHVLRRGLNTLRVALVGGGEGALLRVDGIRLLVQ